MLVSILLIIVNVVLVNLVLEKWSLNVNLEKKLGSNSGGTVWHCSSEPKIENSDKEKL